jgi:hypothetical protein
MDLRSPIFYSGGDQKYDYYADMEDLPATEWIDRMVNWSLLLSLSGTFLATLSHCSKSDNLRWRRWSKEKKGHVWLMYNLAFWFLKPLGRLGQNLVTAGRLYQLMGPSTRKEGHAQEWYSEIQMGGSFSRPIGVCTTVNDDLEVEVSAVMEGLALSHQWSEGHENWLCKC